MPSAAREADAVAAPQVLMIGPVPRVYRGISAVVGTILDSELSSRCRVVYVADGTRQGPLAKLWRFLTALRSTLWHLFRRRVDVMHLHVGDGSSFYRHVLYLMLGRLAGVPVLFHWHLPGDSGAATDFYSTGGALRRRTIRLALKQASRVIVLSASWQPALAAMAPAVRIAILPNPVDCVTIVPAAQPASSLRPTVLFLGDFSHRKGARILLDAAPAVLAQHPTTSFVFCGGKPPGDLEDRAASLGSAVLFPGFVRGDAKLRMLQQASLLALPSYAEGMPIAALEAMAAALPVVATPVGGLPDVIQEGKTGLVVPPGDAQALAGAISQLLADPALGRSMGQQGRQRALAEYDVSIYVERLVALYEEVMDERARQPKDDLP